MSAIDPAPAPIAPSVLIACLEPDFLDDLSDVEILALSNMFDVWARPEQRIPHGAKPWHWYGYLAGRGWGKTTAIPEDITRRIYEGEASHIGLMAPTEDRVLDVQHKALIECAPPWFKPREKKDHLVWPNGATSIMFTPLAPGRPRSENLDLSWLTEIVDWQETTRLEAFNNITTATRSGPGQVYWDTTSRGKNEILQLLFAFHDRDPDTYPIVRGSTFDNMCLSARYLRAECDKYAGREFEEEILGLMFAESAGAMFRQAHLDTHRAPAGSRVRDADLSLRLVSVDPALSNYHQADLFGLVIGARRRSDGHVLIESDLSDHYTPEGWGDVVVEACLRQGAAGAIIERNHAGDNPTFVIRSRASTHGLVVKVLEPEKPFPERTPGVIYVRELVSASSKTSRATGPASEVEAGRVHIAGIMGGLERELTTYEPGTSRSPNRYDAFNQLVSELRDLRRARPSGAARRDVQSAATAMEALSRDLRRRMGGRRVGF